MQKDAVVLCIVTLMLMATGLTLSATSSQARTLTPKEAPPKADVVGKVMSKRDYNVVYTYFNNGTFSVGEVKHYYKFGHSMSYKLPYKKTGVRYHPNEIVGMAMAPDNKVYAWFNDRKFCSGTPTDLSFHSPPEYYSLPKERSSSGLVEKSPYNIVGMAIDQQGIVYTWFNDKTFYTGTVSNLSEYPSLLNYQPLYRGVLGMAINPKGVVYTWYPYKILVGYAPALNQLNTINLRVLRGGP